MSWGLNIVRSPVYSRRRLPALKWKKNCRAISGATRASKSAIGNATKKSNGSNPKTLRKSRRRSARGSKVNTCVEQFLDVVVHLVERLHFLVREPPVLVVLFAKLRLPIRFGDVSNAHYVSVRPNDILCRQ